MTATVIPTARTGTVKGVPVKIVGYREGARGANLTDPTRRTTHLVFVEQTGSYRLGAVRAAGFTPDTGGAS